MKKAMLFALAALCVTAAQAVTVSWTGVTLPNSVVRDGDTTVSQSTYFGDSATAVLNKVKTWGSGVYVGANSGAITGNWQEPKATIDGTTRYEGDWVSNGKTGAVVLAGRGGTGGTSAALVLAVDPGTTIGQLKLSLTVNACTSMLNKDFKYGIGLATTSTFKTATGSVKAESIDANTVDLTLVFDKAYTTVDGDKIIVALNGPGFYTATDPYTITDIKVEYSATVPEPTALALLALGVAGLALKRKVA